MLLIQAIVVGRKCLFVLYLCLHVHHRCWDQISDSDLSFFFFLFLVFHLISFRYFLVCVFFIISLYLPDIFLFHFFFLFPFHLCFIFFFSSGISFLFLKHTKKEEGRELYALNAGSGLSKEQTEASQDFILIGNIVTSIKWQSERNCSRFFHPCHAPDSKTKVRLSVNHPDRPPPRSPQSYPMLNDQEEKKVQL